MVAVGGRFAGGEKNRRQSAETVEGGNHLRQRGHPHLLSADDADHTAGRQLPEQPGSTVREESGQSGDDGQCHAGNAEEVARRALLGALSPRIERMNKTAANR